MTNHFRIHRGARAGSTLVLVTFFLVALFAFAALSLDVGNVYREQRKAHTGTDAGAFGAVDLLTARPQPNIATLTLVATDLAAGNGVTTNEIAAGARNGYPGMVQVGIWRNGVFIADKMTNGLYNAVRVPARRTVPLNFAKVVGLSAMTPAVSSVAMIDGAGTVANAVPFGVTFDQFDKKLPGETMLLNDDAVGSGKQGKIDLGNYQTPGAWQADMLDPDGCNCTVSLGTVPTITGNAQVPQSFNAIPAGTQFILPVVDVFDTTGSKPANIVGFVLVEMVNSSGNGSGWSATVKFVDKVLGSGGGGCPPPCLQARTLTE